jgi:hypothetical protein
VDIDDKILDRFWTKVDKTEDCWLWTRARVPRGYGVFSVTKKWRPYVHRLSWQIHQGTIPATLNVLHTCDNRHCVNPVHLWLGTPEDHASWLKEHQGSTRALVGVHGERNANARLTLEQVHRIRTSAEPPTSLARAFGVQYQTIWKVRTGRTWNVEA